MNAAGQNRLLCLHVEELSRDVLYELALRHLCIPLLYEDMHVNSRTSG